MELNQPCLCRDKEVHSQEYGMGLTRNVDYAPIYARQRGLNPQDVMDFPNIFSQTRMHNKWQPTTTNQAATLVGNPTAHTRLFWWDLTILCMPIKKNTGTHYSGKHMQTHPGDIVWNTICSFTKAPRWFVNLNVMHFWAANLTCLSFLSQNLRKYDSDGKIWTLPSARSFVSPHQERVASCLRKGRT